MTDVMNGLISEAKKNKFSSIGQNTDEDVSSVWGNVSSFIEKQMSQQKGVNIQGLGVFTFTQKKLDVGNNKFILLQRPVFLLSEKVAQTHGLNYTKHHTTGQIPIVQLNYSALSFEGPFDRDTVEACVKEVLQALSRAVAQKKPVEFSFPGIGKLHIKDSKVKMRFYKDFLNSMDGSGNLVEALKDRPGTVDSVMSNRSPSRPMTGALILPSSTDLVSEGGATDYIRGVEICSRLGLGWALLPKISQTNLVLDTDRAGGDRGGSSRVDRMVMPTINEEKGGGNAPIPEQAEEYPEDEQAPGIDSEAVKQDEDLFNLDPPEELPNEQQDLGDINLDMVDQDQYALENEALPLEENAINSLPPTPVSSPQSEKSCDGPQTNISQSDAPTPSSGKLDSTLAVEIKLCPMTSPPASPISFSAGTPTFTPPGSPSTLRDSPSSLTKYPDAMKKPSPPPFATGRGSRMAVQLAQASGISFVDDLLPHAASPKGMRRNSVLSKSSPSPRMLKRSLSPLNYPNGTIQRPESMNPVADAHTPRSKSAESYAVAGEAQEPKVQFMPTPPATAPPASACGHKDAGQELCYLCHQRDRRNIPVSFTEERQQREKEEGRLLQQYQHMKDAEAILREQENLYSKRRENQKMAAFNLGVSEAIKTRKYNRLTDFQPSYIFQKRPLTPPRFIKQEKYFGELSNQVKLNDDQKVQRRADEEFLERLEQVQLAEDLAAQREQYLKDKMEQQDQYKRALSAQIRVRDSVCKTQEQACPIRAGRRLGPLTLPRPQIVLPFAQTYTMTIQEGSGDKKRMVRFKPLQMPARVPDSHDPVFGKHDMTNEALAERRYRAHDLYREQLNTVEQRKRDAILKRLTDQKEEDDMLRRTKKELLDDRADNFERMYHSRKKLEDDWRKATHNKKSRDLEDRVRAASPGMLLHEQCDKYTRCGQCERKMHNVGESNIWRESRYIPGSRLMV